MAFECGSGGVAVAMARAICEAEAEARAFTAFFRNAACSIQLIWGKVDLDSHRPDTPTYHICRKNVIYESF